MADVAYGRYLRGEIRKLIRNIDRRLSRIEASGAKVSPHISERFGELKSIAEQAIIDFNLSYSNESIQELFDVYNDLNELNSRPLTRANVVKRLQKIRNRTEGGQLDRDIWKLVDIGLDIYAGEEKSFKYELKYYIEELIATDPSIPLFGEGVSVENIIRKRVIDYMTEQQTKHTKLGKGKNSFWSYVHRF